MSSSEFQLGDAYPDMERWQLPQTLMDMVCLLSDGRLLVSQASRFTSQVGAFIGRLERKGIKFEEVSATLEDIAKAYAHAPVSGKVLESNSDTQAAATEIFKKAALLRASDIHFRVSEAHRTQILFRIHNDLVQQEEHSFDYGSKLCTTIYQAMADVSDATFEKLRSQDARISNKATLAKGLDGIRIATAPMVGGFCMVLRLLYNDANTSDDPMALGYTAQQSSQLRLMKSKPTGLNIVGGPTGSGKSTTLQVLLTSIIKDSKGRHNIITVEDPPEYPIPGAVQTPVTNAETAEERSVAFQGAIKGAMRMDPDVIMIGEVRDTPSARLAVQAAMTGHQVWTTIHANSAFAMIDRLVDLGVDEKLVHDPSILTGLTCQRLLKLLCPSCKRPLASVAHEFKEEDLQRVLSVGPLPGFFVRGAGCDACQKTGIKGRTVVAETLITDERLMAFIRANDRAGAIGYWKEHLNGKTMLDVAIEKINQGLVDPFQAEVTVGQLNDTRGLA